MAGFGLVGAATANAPRQTIEEMIAAEQARAEVERKAALESERLKLDTRRVADQEAGTTLNRDQFTSQQTAAQAAAARKAEVLKRLPTWLQPAAELRDAFGMSVDAEDIAMSPEQQHNQRVTDETTKARAAAAARAEDDKRRFGYDMTRDAANDSRDAARDAANDARDASNPNKPPKPPTGADKRTLTFYLRGKNATEDIMMPDKSGKALEDRIARSGLIGLGMLNYAPDIALGDDNRAYRQAQRAFTEARLRKDSGAAVPDAEYEKDAKTYFAQPGDKPVDVERKRKGREAILDALASEAGNAYTEHFGTPYTPKARQASAAPPANPKMNDTWESPTGPTKWDGRMWKPVR